MGIFFDKKRCSFHSPNEAGIYILFLYCSIVIGVPVASQYSASFYRLYNSTLTTLAKKNDSVLIERLKQVVIFADTVEYFSSRGNHSAGADLFDLKVDELCAKYDIKRAGIVSMKRRHSNRLFELFGRDFFDLFESHDNIPEIDKRIEDAYTETDPKLSISSSDFVPSDVVKSVSAVSHSQLKGIKMQDCGNEAQFLITHSKATLSNELESLDLARVKFLLGVLDGNIGTPQERRAFRTLMTKPKEGINE